MKRSYSWRTALAIGTASIVAILDLGPSNPVAAQVAPQVISQSLDSLATCKAPGSNEYLLLVVLQTDEAQSKLLETLPPSVQAPTCNYLGSRVARMGGFQKPEDADAWASYLRDVASLPAFVAKPTQRNLTGLGSATTQIQDPANLAIPTANSQSKPSTPGSPQTAIASNNQSNDSAVSPLTLLPPPVIPTQPRTEAKVDVPQVGSSSLPLNSPPPNLQATPTKPSRQNTASASIVAPPVAPPAVFGATTSVTTPGTAPSPTIAQAPVTAPTSSPAETFSVTSYEPKVLSNGYVVLVDYGNRTALVSLLRQRTSQPVGLASYGQRPFLMASYTPDSKSAITTLSSLNAMGFRTLLVDASQVTLLTPDVQVK